MASRYYAAISRVTGEVLMVHKGSYVSAVTAFDRQFGTAEDYSIEILTRWSDPQQPVVRESRY
jgi:hypothetical protein